MSLPTNTNKIQDSLVRCLHFAAEAHKDQRRKDLQNTPYINHPIGVAYIISEEAGVTNLDLIRGSLLHDTVEDTAVSIDEIYAEFLDYIGKLVQDVTDDKNLPKQKRKDLQVIHAPSTSPQAKMVKMADKLYNLRDLERCIPKGWTEERRDEYFKWALKVCEGLLGVNSKLEAKLNDVFTRRGMVLGNDFRGKLDTLWPSHDHLKPLITAANFAAEKHSRHFMFDATNTVPYINHLISVCFILYHEAGTEQISILSAALLYAVVGKTDTKIEEVEKIFGKEVSEVVFELTYDHSIPVDEQFKFQNQKIGLLSRHAKLISLAAALDSCLRLEGCEPEGWGDARRKEYFRKTQEATALLAGTNDRLETLLKTVWVRQGE